MEPPVSRTGYTDCMSLITTKSYELVVNETGNPDAAKCALVLPGRLESKDYAHIQSHAAALAAVAEVIRLYMP